MKATLSNTKVECGKDNIIGYRILFSPDRKFTAVSTSDKGFPTGFYSKPLLNGVEVKEWKGK